MIACTPQKKGTAYLMNEPQAVYRPRDGINRAFLRACFQKIRIGKSYCFTRRYYQTHLTVGALLQTEKARTDHSSETASTQVRQIQETTILICVTMQTATSFRPNIPRQVVRALDAIEVARCQCSISTARFQSD